MCPTNTKFQIFTFCELSSAIKQGIYEYRILIAFIGLNAVKLL